MFAIPKTSGRRTESGRFASRDAKDATRQLQAAGLGLEVRPLGQSDGGISMSWAGLEPDETICMHWRLSQPFELVYQPIDAYQLLLSSSGTTSVVLASGPVPCESQGASVFNIRDMKSVECSADTENYVVVVPHRMLTKRIFELTGAPVLRKLVFGGQSVLGEAWMHAVAAMTIALEALPAIPGLRTSPHSIERSSEMIADLMLELMSHNYMDAISGKDAIIAPDYVKRTVAFMRRGTGEPLKVEGLIPVSGVSTRTLQYAFARFIGISISDYERSIRLERAHQDIQRRPKERLATIAKRWRFTNITRFNAQFEAQYGITATLWRDICLNTPLETTLTAAVATK